MDSERSTPVTVVGAGISGIACANALDSAGVPARVLDRSHRPGGRMAGRTIDGRIVDIGASYVTADAGSRFAEVVNRWIAGGLARAWTDTFAVADADGIHSSSTGPVRYAARDGLRSVVADLAGGVDLTTDRNIESVARGSLDGAAAAEIVLAMPDPQARRMLAPDEPVAAALGDIAWEPIIAVVLSWPQRRWEADLHGAFVNDSAELGFIADDGDRRGDGAAVLVAHTTTGLAARHLDDPDAAIPTVTAAVQRVLGVADAPTGSVAHRWTFARPTTTHDAPFGWADGVGVCGDAWGGPPSVRTAWASGDALGRAIAAQRG